MTGLLTRFPRGQGGYTLIEVVIASAMGAVVMGALVSVILTTVTAGNVAASRVEASSQIRSFQLFADDDFARSGIPDASGCGTPANPCTTEAIELNGFQASNSATPVAALYEVTYTWDGSSFLDRQVGSNPATHVAVGVTGFAWYVDDSAPNQTVVATITVTVRSYSETQTLRFLPHLNP